VSNLPVIVGFGGISPAGRTSFNQGYKRLVFDKLSQAEQQEVLQDLKTITGDRDSNQADLLDKTLIRKIPKTFFDADQVLMNKGAVVKSGSDSIRFQLRKRYLPTVIPSHWSITEIDAGTVEVSVQGEMELLFPDTRELPVQSAGMLPDGFEPGKLYQSRNHPRAIQMAIYAASDALASVGIDVDSLLDTLAPDQIAVFASNSIGQLDDLGFGGLTKYPALGKRTTSKQMPLGYAQMPADFVNAYMLGNLGTTGGALGACATFLYNLRNGVEAIRTGKAEFVLVGGADAPVTPEVIEGFRAMGALAEDKQLQALDKLANINEVDHRRACRPFGENCGFTIGESAQFIVLMSDRLAIESGANIYGSVPDVYVHADGYKKSISAPGVGNYLTLGKAAALIEKLLGSDALKHHSMIQAHGTSTPQNRTTESHVLNQIAKAFDIQDWTVAAVKAYLGHSQGTAGGDQLVTTLGVWSHGIIPGITTTRAIAEDVYASNLNLPLAHMEVGTNHISSALINSKGFGGNNATAALLSPEATKKLLTKRYGEKAMTEWQHKAERTIEIANAYNQAAIKGDTAPTYRYDYRVLNGEDLDITHAGIRVPEHSLPVSFDVANPYDDLV
jgi:acetoacetyl-[acyl-carrier protein] synthase